jgi:hypothetical protein
MESFSGGYPHSVVEEDLAARLVGVLILWRSLGELDFDVALDEAIWRRHRVVVVQVRVAWHGQCHLGLLLLNSIKMRERRP